MLRRISKRKIAITAACLLLLYLGLFVYGKWSESRRISVCNGKYVLADQYYEDWKCHFVNLDLTDGYYEDQKCHYVYTDNNGVTFEIIAWKEFIPMFDSRESILKFPIRYPIYRCTYRDGVVEARKEQIDELNHEYEEYIIAGIETRMEHSGLYDFNTIERKGDIPDEEWIIYASEYISRLDEIYSFEEMRTQTPWIESWADYIELGMRGIRVEYDKLSRPQLESIDAGNLNEGRCIIYSTTEEGRLTPDQIYHALYYRYLLDEKGVPYIPPSER